MVRVPTVCVSLAAGQSRQDRSEYRAHRETDAKHPRNTDPGGKYGIQGRRGIDRANTTELVIPILWGRNTDPTGKSVAYDRRRCAIYGGPWCTKYPLATLFRAKARAVQPCLPDTDPVGKEYRPHRERMPTTGGDIYRSGGENLPIPAGGFTDRVGVDYRPLGETGGAKPLQISAIYQYPLVYMMLCLCLVFCLVNREVMGV